MLLRCRDANIDKSSQGRAYILQNGTREGTKLAYTAVKKLKHALKLQKREPNQQRCDSHPPSSNRGLVRLAGPLSSTGNTVRVSLVCFTGVPSCDKDSHVCLCLLSSCEVFFFHLFFGINFFKVPHQTPQLIWQVCHKV